jgi:hypothetical protein
MIVPSSFPEEFRQQVVDSIQHLPILWPEWPGDEHFTRRWKLTEPIPKPGLCLLLADASTRDESRGVIVACDIGRKHEQGWLRPEWRDSAVGSLHQAHAAVLKKVQGAFAPPPPLADEAFTLSFDRLGSTPSIAGESCGLSLFLGLASLWLRRPLPDDLVASARIRQGGLASVEGLSTKFDAVRAAAPRARRFLVAAGQSSTFRDDQRSDPHLRIVEVESLQDALREAKLWPPETHDVAGLASWFDDVPQTALRTMVTTAWDVAMGNTATPVEWRAYRHMASWFLTADGQSRLTAVHPELAPKAQVAAAIILRHCAASVRQTIDPSWYMRQPRLTRDRLASQLIQAARDYGNPSVDEAPRLAHETIGPNLRPCLLGSQNYKAPVGMSVPGSTTLGSMWRGLTLDLGSDQLKALGATARLLASDRVQLTTAIWANWALCLAWWDNHSPVDMSYAFSELLRLTTLNDPAHEVAKWCESDVTAVTGISPEATENEWYLQHVWVASVRTQGSLTPDVRSLWNRLPKTTAERVRHRMLFRAALLLQEPEESLRLCMHRLNAELRRDPLELDGTPCDNHIALSDALSRVSDADPKSNASQALCDIMERIEAEDHATVHFARVHHPDDPVEQARYVVRYHVY